MTNWPAEVTTIIAVLTMIGGGAAYIMRSIGSRFDEVDERLTGLDKTVGDVRERVARIEGWMSRRR